MFDSPQFKENINCYQQLLSEGVFDLSFIEAKTEDCKTLKRLTLSNLSKSKWVERYHPLKVCIDLFKVGTLLHENINSSEGGRVILMAHCLLLLAAEV
jgi:hypothetical protein